MNIKKKTTVSQSSKPQSLPGLADIIPGQDNYWDFVISHLQRIARGYGFNRIEMPLLENISLYAQTEFAENNEAVDFVDNSATKIAVRAASMPSLMRAFHEYKIPEGHKVSKWYYLSPVLSYDQKQKQYISSWQYGFEMFGEFSPLNEVQMISLLWKFFKAIGLQNVSLEIDSLGDEACKGQYEEALTGYLQSKKYELCNDCVAAIEEFPMQVFRCNNLECKTVATDAQQSVDFLDTACHKHLTNVLEGLDELGIMYALNPMLAGKKGTSKTTFAFKHTETTPTGTVDRFLGEGAYHDQIYKELTGKNVVCFGFHSNIESLQKAVKEQKQEQIETLAAAKAEVFLAPLGDLASKKAIKLFSELWDAQVSVHDHFGGEGVKNQLKLAEGSKAMIALIIGQKEAMDDMVILRDVKSGMQEVFRYDQIIEEVKKRLGK